MSEEQIGPGNEYGAAVSGLSLLSLESGLPTPLFDAADAFARQAADVAPKLLQLTEDAAGELRQVLAYARPDVAAVATDELDDLAVKVQAYRDEVWEHVAVRDPLRAERFHALENRISELELLQAAKVEEERRMRGQIESVRDERHLDRLRGVAAPGAAPRRWYQLRQPENSAAKTRDHDYQALLEGLRDRKKAIADVATVKYGFKLQMKELWDDEERRLWANPQISNRRDDATASAERAVQAVAEKGLLRVYRSWLGTHVRDELRTETDREAVNEPKAPLAAPRRRTDSEFDVFISHASEDKAAVARPLSDLLRERGLRVWLDEQELVLGDVLGRKIDDGLARSRFGIVVLSRHFFGKNWPQRELDGLVARETLNDDKVILPVWHGVSLEDVMDRSPPLAARLAVDTSRGMEHVAGEVLRAFRPAGDGPVAGG